jgi:hypothetical protein
LEEGQKGRVEGAERKEKMRAMLRQRLSGFEQSLETAEGHRPRSTEEVGVPYGI